MKNALTYVPLSAALLTATIGTAEAASGYTGIHPQMSSVLQIAGGAFFNRSNTTYELDSDSGKGTEIDPGDLGMDEDNTVPFASLRWRFRDRWRLEANWFKTDNDGSEQISERIEWGDLDFEAGANVKIENETSILRGAIGYSFLKNERAELGAGIGIHHLNVDTELSGNATINGMPVLSASETSSIDGFAPNLAFFGGYAINERWLLSGRVDWISADVGDLDGKLWRVGASALYQPFKHAGFGAGYDWISVDLNEDSDDGGKNRWDGNIHGPMLFVTLNFL